MTKQQELSRQSEREMRDQMNKIVRDKNGKVISRNGKLVEIKNDQPSHN